jgi:hypothetical protein
MHLFGKRPAQHIQKRKIIIINKNLRKLGEMAHIVLFLLCTLQLSFEEPCNNLPWEAVKIAARKCTKVIGERMKL